MHQTKQARSNLALKQLNKQVIDFKSLPQPKPEDSRMSGGAAPFFEAYFEGYSSEQFKAVWLTGQVYG